MMITTKKTKTYRLLLLSLAIAVLSLIAYRVFLNPSTETLNVKTFRVSGGWGYQISHQSEALYLSALYSCYSG